MKSDFGVVGSAVCFIVGVVVVVGFIVGVVVVVGFREFVFARFRNQR